MKRVKGFLHRCERCGMLHDTKGSSDGACRAWFGSLGQGNHGVTVMAWEALLEARVGLT